jgi:cystathionine beta-lyase family protein involved in aluminum resistance
MNIYESFDIHPDLWPLVEAAEARIAETFGRIEDICEANSLKVLAAFTGCGVSSAHLLGSTGYGYNDSGRDMLDRVFARAVGAPAAIVRHGFVSGTHAIATALYGVLRPGDRMVSITGQPYDTLLPIMGLGSELSGSLKDYGIICEVLNLLSDGRVDTEGLAAAVRGAKMAYIQRSRGYSLRPSLSIKEIERLCTILRQIQPDIVIMVDNCYGEFVETREPTAVGADLMAGSLIKNPGGGIARTGGYIAGRADLVELCADRLTCPGMGTEVGCSLDELRAMYLGLFYAPGVVAAAVKTAVFAAALFEDMGYTTYPASREARTDIIETLVLGDPERMVAFCKAVQRVSPIDSMAAPEPGDMPGYAHPVIMAAGAFTQGASIELSADGPIREPYAVSLQGGLNYPTGKIGVLSAADALYRLNN